MTHHNPEPFIPAQPASSSPNLPAIIDQLPPDASHPAQTQFTRLRQAAFLRRLADTGEVRVAARASNVSHQTVYRMRRACGAFRQGWDAALLIARERAEDMLATRALHGVEEQVFYHGEVVATRRRYDSRLLLAHLARLDRLAERADVAALANSFDDVIAAIEAAAEGEEPDLPEVQAGDGAGAPEDTGADTGADAPSKTASGPCHMRSMSRPQPALEERLAAMDAAWPSGVERRSRSGESVAAADAREWAQLLAFEAGEARWWEARA
ncbi:MAG: hypothetical protein AAGJ85_07620, partial [Pseudomonadota bacterium]